MSTRVFSHVQDGQTSWSLSLSRDMAEPRRLSVIDSRNLTVRQGINKWSGAALRLIPPTGYVRGGLSEFLSFDKSINLAQSREAPHLGTCSNVDFETQAISECPLVCRVLGYYLRSLQIAHCIRSLMPPLTCEYLQLLLLLSSAGCLTLENSSH